MGALLTTHEENAGIGASAHEPASEAEAGAPPPADTAEIPHPTRIAKNAERQQRRTSDGEWLARLLREMPRLGKDGFYGSGL
jgi:hypothetical protein